MKNRKNWLAISFACIILGVAVLIAGRLIGGRAGFYIDRNGIHTAGDPDRTTPVRGSRTLDRFNRMEVSIDYADVELVVSDRFAIEYCVAGNHGEPICEVNNGTLIFREPEPVQFYNIGFFTGSFGIMIDEPRYFVKIEIPDKERFKKAAFDIDSGNLDIDTLQADELNIRNEYGDVRLDWFDGDKLDIHMDSGNVSLGTIAAVQAELKNEYGETEISKARGNHLTIQMDSGNCRIDRADFPDIQITNEYGDIRLGLPGDIEDYGFDLSAEYGSIRVGNENRGNDDWDDAVYRSSGDNGKSVKISCESGNIEIKSAKSL